LFSEAKERCITINHNGNRIGTTLGKLIATISDVAFEYSDDYKEAYDLTRLVVTNHRQQQQINRNQTESERNRQHIQRLQRQQNEY
jgi:hypothetical protein